MRTSQDARGEKQAARSEIERGLEWREGESQSRISLLTSRFSRLGSPPRVRRRLATRSRRDLSSELLESRAVTNRWAAETTNPGHCALEGPRFAYRARLHPLLLSVFRLHSTLGSHVRVEGSCVRVEESRVRVTVCGLRLPSNQRDCQDCVVRVPDRSVALAWSSLRLTECRLRRRFCYVRLTSRRLRLMVRQVMLPERHLRQTFCHVRLHGCYVRLQDCYVCLQGWNFRLFRRSAGSMRRARRHHGQVKIDVGTVFSRAI